MVHDANLILIGTVSRTAADAANSEGGTVWVRPEAFLKGNPSAAEIAFSTGLPGPCAASSVTAGDRLLLVARSGDGLTPLPGPERLYRLADGVARSLNRGDSSAIIESEFVARVRALTNQYAVPASSSSEGASIDWTGTILPVGAALAAIFVVALVLMRTWHRIDPS
jgi:hypothetical protein